MKKGFCLILSILFICSCTGNSSKQNDLVVSSNSVASVSETISNDTQVSINKTSESSTVIEKRI